MPLRDLRVVELGSLAAASYCARLFADFGAEVLKIEPPEGDASRRIAPLIAIAHDQEESVFFGYLNARKRSLRIDPQSADDRERLQSLILEADVLVDSLGEVQRKALGIDHDDLRRARPGMAIASVSWFGESGPYRDFSGTDAVCRALAGLAYSIGPQGGPPVPLPDYQGAIVGGYTAFIPLMATVMSRESHGGRRFEISVHESNLTVADYNVALSWGLGAADKRWGVNRFVPNFPLGIYRCKRGWIGVTVVTPVQWKAFCSLLGIEDIGADPHYAINRDRLKDADKLEARFASKFMEKTAEEWFQLALDARLPFVVVPGMAEVLTHPEHRRRDAFETLHHGNLRYEVPASPLRLAGTPPHRGGQVAALNEHESSCAWASRSDAARLGTVAGSSSRRPPLEGTRVVDLSMGWAGPTATRHLADLGADVIKVEACQYPDWWRGVDNRPVVFEKMLYEKSVFFTVMNRNKRDITLDLTTEDGVRLLKQLIADAEIVVENYSAGVLPKLGLDYPALKIVNPAIVMVSMPAFAADGAWSECRAYGSTLEQASGLPSVSGLADGPPAMNHIAYGDPIGGLTATCALLIALHHRRRTGEGQHIHLSQVECMLPMVAPWIAEQSATGTVGPRLGTRHPAFVPHGSFPCRGDDRWVMIAITDDMQWQQLCRVIGRPDWTKAPALASAEGRRQHEAEIEAGVAAWTRTQEADEAMQGLQAAGIPAGVVRVPFELLQDPHLRARSFWRWIDHPFIGRHPQPCPGYRDADLPYPDPVHAPTLGQHNTDVLPLLLQLSPAEMEALAERHVIGTKALPPSMRKARAAVG